MTCRVLPTVAATLAVAALAAAPAGAARVAARPADAFVDSMCVATHFGFGFTGYASRYPEVRDKLLALGVRHIRDSGVDATDKLRDLAGRGIRTTFMLDPATGTVPGPGYWSKAPGIPIVEYLRERLGLDAVDAVEMISELDLHWPQGYLWRPDDAAPIDGTPSSPTFFGRYLRAITADAYRAVKSDPATAGVPVYGPPFYGEQAYVAAGDLSSYVDAANVHWFLSGRHPETAGWGDAGYGSLRWEIEHLARVQAPGEPYVATEAGYSNATAADHRYPPEDVVARYLPRLMLYAFNGGLRRTCVYELLDERDDPSRQDAEAHFGLLRADLSEKPAYTALRNLVGLLRDPGPAFRAGQLDLALSGDTTDVNSTLLRKRDGTYWLALWLGRESYDPVNGGEHAVPAQGVQVDVPAWITAARAYRFDDRGTVGQAPLTVRGGHVGIAVRDRVTLLRLTPRRAPFVSGTVRPVGTTRATATLTVRRAPGGSALRSLQLALPRGLELVRARGRQITARADGRRAPATAVVVAGRRTLRLGPPATAARRVVVRLPRGTLRSTASLRRKRWVAVRVRATDDAGRTRTVAARLRVRR